MHRLCLRCLPIVACIVLTLFSSKVMGQTAEERAEADLKPLAERAAQASGDRDKLRHDLLAFQQRYPGTSQAVRAAGLLRDLASPLDQLDAKMIPALERFDWQPKELVAVLGEHRGRHAGAVTAVAYSRNGKWLVSGGSNGSIRFWDPATMRLLHVVGHSSGSLSLSFSKDSNLLASGGGDGHVRIWDLSEGKPKDKITFKVASTPLYGIALHPSGKLVALGGGDNRLYIFDLTEDPPKETTAADVHTAAIMSVAFSPDGKTLLTGSQDKTVRLWTLGKENRAAAKAVGEGHTAGVLSVAFHPNENKVVSGGADSTIRMWNVSDKSLAARQVVKSAGGAVHSVTFSLSGKTLGSGHADGTGRSYAVTPAVQEKTVLEGHIAAVSSIAFAPDGQTVATGSQDWTVRLWPGVAGPKPKDRTVKVGHLSHVYNVAFAPDSKSLASGSYDRSLRLWDLVAAEPKERLPNIKPDSIVYSLAFSPDSKTVVAGGAGANFRLYDVFSRKFLWTFTGHQGQISRVGFAADGNLIVSCSNDKTMRLWDPKTGKDVHIFNTYEAAVNSCAFSPDGKHVVSSSGYYTYDKMGQIVRRTDGTPVYLDSTVRIYDVESKKETYRWKDDRLIPSGVGFTPDSRRLFAGGSDAMLRTWNTPDPKSSDPGVFYKGTYGVSALAFTPDGRWLASWGPDYRVTLWDLAAGKKLRDWVLHEQFGALALSSDSRHLAISLGTGVTYVLRLSEPGRTLLNPTEKEPRSP